LRIESKDQQLRIPIGKKYIYNRFIAISCILIFNFEGTAHKKAADTRENYVNAFQFGYVKGCIL